MASINTPSPSEHTLVRRTLRTTGLLVGALVVFVGVLSILAVFVTSKAVGAGAGAGSSAQGKDTPDAVKKPLSI